MYIGSNRLQAIAYDMLGLNVIDPITVEYLEKHNKKGKKSGKKEEGNDDIDPDEQVQPKLDTSDEDKKMCLKILNHFKDAVVTDVAVLSKVGEQVDGMEDDVTRPIEKRIKELTTLLKNIEHSISILTRPANDAQSQLQAQRERDLKGNPLVYKAWKRVTPSLQDDCDDAW